MLCVLFSLSTSLKLAFLYIYFDCVLMYMSICIYEYMHMFMCIDKVLRCCRGMGESIPFPCPLLPLNRLLAFVHLVLRAMLPGCWLLDSFTGSSLLPSKGLNPWPKPKCTGNLPTTQQMWCQPPWSQYVCSYTADQHFSSFFMRHITPGTRITCMVRAPGPRLLLISPVCYFCLVLRALHSPSTQMNSRPQKSLSSPLQPFSRVSSSLWIRTRLLTSFNLLPSFESAANEIHVHLFVNDLTCLNQICLYTMLVCWRLCLGNVWCSLGPLES